MSSIESSGGRCPCGMIGIVSDRTHGRTTAQSWTVTSRTSPVAHRSNWWWSPTARRFRGVCCETGRRSSEGKDPRR